MSEPRFGAFRQQPVLAAALFVLASAGYLIGLIQVGRPLSWDEVEFYRATEWVSSGRVPFLDFYEHHAPLQWFVFAPVAWLLDGPGVATVLAMRWAQLPLVLALLALLDACAKRVGASGASRAAVVALVASTAFAHSAIEYRVDTLGTLLLVFGLSFVLAPEREVRHWLAAGALFAGAGLSNLRLGPLLVVAALAAAIHTPRAGRWSWSSGLPWIVAGGLLALLPMVAYLAAHEALGVAVERLIVDNAMGDSALEYDSGRFFGVLAVLLGWRSASGSSGFERLLDLDLPGSALLLLGLVGSLRGLRQLRSGSPLALVALLHWTNLLFVLRMRAIYDYHFQAVLVLSALLAPEAVRGENWGRRLRGLLFGVAGVGFVIGFANLALRNLGPTLDYQDLVMREADLTLPRAAPVWDGVGFALRREGVRPDLWFQPSLVRNLARSGRIPPLTTEELERNPPSAILYNARIRHWLNSWKPLHDWVTMRYAPVRQQLWLPVPNARLGAGSGRVAWTVATAGAHRVVASRALASHPWFRKPLSVGAAFGPGKGTLRLQVVDHRELTGRGVSWSLNGAPVEAIDGLLRLERGDQLELRWGPLDAPIGLFLVPEEIDELFVMSPDGVDLELPPRFGPLRGASR